MFKTASCILTGLTLIGLACSSPVKQNDDPGSILKTGSPFTLKLGETVTLSDADLTVTFADFLGDSRCPSDVVCIWEGKATIDLRLVESESDTHSVVLDLYGLITDQDPPSTKDTLGYRFYFLGLDPYPISTVTIPNSERVATLAIFPYLSPGDPDGEVHFSNQTLENIQKDPWDLMGHELKGEVLTLDVMYGGGCNDHSFELCMSPSAFMESSPVQANLYLRHDGHDDACDALIRHDVRFDLTPLAQLHQLAYGGSAPIRLHLIHYRGEGQPIQTTDFLYTPPESVTQ